MHIESPLKPVQHLILLLLAKEPTYGVDLLARIDERSRGSIRLNAGSLYRLVGQLLDDGLIEIVDTRVPPSGHGAPRKVYGVTEGGRVRLAAEARRQSELLELARSLDLIGDA